MKYLVLIIAMSWSINTYAEERIVSYTVLEGDWIYKILRSYNKETKQQIINQILNLNPQISNADLVYPGQTLLVPITFKRAVEKSWKKRGIVQPPSRMIQPQAPNQNRTQPRTIIVEKPAPPAKVIVKEVVKEKIKYVYLDEVKKDHFFTFAPLYSYSRLDYNSSLFAATAVSKVNYGMRVLYSEKTGDHQTNYQFDYNQFKYNDKSTGLDNRSFANLSIAFEKAWRKNIFEIAPGVSFGQYHYLKDNPVTNRLDFFKETQPGLSVRLALVYEGTKKNVEVGIKSLYLLSATGENIEIDDSFLHEIYFKATLKVRKKMFIDISPSYQTQTTKTSESEHIFQHLGLRIGLVYYL